LQRFRVKGRQIPAIYDQTSVFEAVYVFIFQKIEAKAPKQIKTNSKRGQSQRFRKLASPQERGLEQADGYDQKYVGA
jgi:hypothetical protein